MLDRIAIRYPPLSALLNGGLHVTSSRLLGIAFARVRTTIGGLISNVIVLRNQCLSAALPLNPCWSPTSNVSILFVLLIGILILKLRNLSSFSLGIISSFVGQVSKIHILNTVAFIVMQENIFPYTRLLLAHIWVGLWITREGSIGSLTNLRPVLTSRQGRRGTVRVHIQPFVIIKLANWNLPLLMGQHLLLVGNLHWLIIVRSLILRHPHLFPVLHPYILTLVSIYTASTVQSMHTVLTHTRVFVDVLIIILHKLTLHKSTLRQIRRSVLGQLLLWIRLKLLLLHIIILRWMHILLLLLLHLLFSKGHFLSEMHFSFPQGTVLILFLLQHH